jgi:CelD/BcsL family acetyltransferase involved in cellulose biosynthesis
MGRGRLPAMALAVFRVRTFRRQLGGLRAACKGMCAARDGERMSGFTIVELADPRWADFVARQPSATPFHHPNWARLIADCYGFRAFAAAISDATGEIRAGLPVVEVRHLRGEPKWVSLPFTDYCPPLVPAPQEETDLLGAVRRAGKAAGIRTVEVRAPLEGASPVSRGALRHVIALDGDPAAVQARFRRSVRKNIRRAGRSGVTIRQAERPEDLVDTFYRLHLRTRRRFGVPIQPRRFFRMLWESMIRTGLGSVFIAEASGRPVAAEVFLDWNGTAISKYSASDERAWSLRANSLITWHLIKTSCEQGSRWFDFGRTDAGNEGLRAFKQSWGAAEEPLCYGTFGAGPQPAAGRDGIADHLLASVIRHGPPVLCRAAGETLYRYAA